MTTLFRIVLVLLMSCVCAHADTIREALVNLCDPAKIATIKMDSKFKLLALDDGDLLELWDSFKA